MTNIIKFSFTQPNRDLGTIGEVREVNSLRHLYEMLRYECKLLVEETPKQNLSRFIPSIFTGNRRITAEFAQTKLLVLDVDEGDPSDFLVKMTNQNIGFILYETPGSTPTQPKFRIIFQTSEPITSAQHFKQTYKNLFDNQVVYDPACNDPSRLFYIPNISKVDTFFLNEGNPLYVAPSQVGDKLEKLENLETTQDVDNMESFFLESGEIVTLKLNKILAYLIDHDLTITASHKNWLAVCFACVSLKHHNLSKTACLEYFISFSNLDKEKCESQEKLIEKFEYCWKNTHNNYSIGTIYFFAKEVGCPLPKINSEIIKLVRVPESKNFNLALNNTESDDIVPLHHDVQEASISREKIVVAQADIFSLKSNDVITFRENPNTGEVKEVFLDSIARFVAKYETQPQQTVYLLGHNKQGTFYEKSTKSILIANHYRVPCKAVFHEDIHQWLSQIHIQTNFIYSYLFHFTNMEVALPILNLWGESDAGKSLFVRLLGSVFSNPPIED